MRRPSFISWEQVRVGLLILGALALLAVAMVRLGAAARLFTDRYTLVTFVPNANGLVTGGSAMIAGQLAGTVRSIEFLEPDADTLRNLRLTLEIDRALQPQVRADSRARIRTLGLLGDRVVDISPGTPRYPILANGDTIVTLPSVDYDQVLAEASGAVGDVVALTADLRTITAGLARGDGTIGQLLTNRELYDEFTGSLRQTNALLVRMQSPDGTLGRLLDDPTLYQSLNGAVASVDSLLRRFQSEQGTLGRLMRDDSLYTRMLGVVDGADSLLALVRGGDGLAARLLTDRQLYDQLNATLLSLDSLLADVRKDPRRYTRGMIRVF